MRSRLGTWILACALLPGADTALACDLQRGNEVYLDARDEVSRLRPAEKARIAQEWAELETEQKSLWSLAGSIDEECRRGELSEQIAPYNVRVYEWQDQLRKFLKRMRTPTENPSARPDPEPVTPAGNAAVGGVTEIDFRQAAEPKAKAAPKPSPAAPRPEPSGETLTPPALL